MQQLRADMNSKTAKRKRRLELPPWLVAVAFLSGVTTLPSYGSNGNQIFKDKCAGCHTIGKGVLVGPDLVEAKKLSETELRANVKRMEKMAGPLSEEEVDTLVNYIKEAPQVSAEPAASQGVAQTEAVPAKEAAPAEEAVQGEEEPADANRGRDFYFGRRPFKNGGMACAACHSLDGRGGTLAPDLLDESKKLPEKALIAACQETPYKVMKAAYLDKKLTRQESLDVAHFLATVQKGEQQAAPPLVLYGLAGGLLTIMTAAFSFALRKGSARDRLTRR